MNQFNFEPASKPRSRIRLCPDDERISGAKAEGASFAAMIAGAREIAGGQQLDHLGRAIKIRIGCYAQVMTFVRKRTNRRGR
jgi:hypothetical protein